MGNSEAVHTATYQKVHDKQDVFADIKFTRPGTIIIGN